MNGIVMPSNEGRRFGTMSVRMLYIDVRFMLIDRDNMVEWISVGRLSLSLGAAASLKGATAVLSPVFSF